MIHWESCKWGVFEFQKRTQSILWDFKIQTDHLLLARKPNTIIINHKITYSSRSQGIKSWKTTEILRPFLRTELLWTIILAVIIVITGFVWISSNNQEHRRRELKIQGRIKTIQSTAVLWSIKAFRNDQENGGAGSWENFFFGWEGRLG